jgi:dienelactone hydrolase
MSRISNRVTFVWLGLLCWSMVSCAASSGTSPLEDADGGLDDASDVVADTRDASLMEKAQGDQDGQPDVGEASEEDVPDAGPEAEADTGITRPPDVAEEQDGSSPDVIDTATDQDVGPSENGELVLSDPGEPGSFTWNQASQELQLPGGLFGTTIPLDVFLPNDSNVHPVIVFTHGYQLGPANYRSLVEHLASWGYVVVMPQMPGGLTTHKTLKERLIAILDWIGDQSIAADGVLYGRVDPALLGLSGHSMGGKISLLVSSGDARPKAAFLLDPVDAAGMPVVLNPADYPSVTPELMPYVTIPLGFAGETTDAECSGFLCQACAPAEDNFQQYYLHAQSPAIEITIHGAGHMSFLDDPDCGLLCSVCNEASDDPATTRLLSRRYMTAFYNVWLKGDDAYREYLTGAAMEADVASGLVDWQAKHGF